MAPIPVPFSPDAPVVLPADATLIPLADLARELGVHYDTARSAARLGHLIAWRVGRRLWTTRESAAAYFGVTSPPDLIPLPEAARRLGVGNGTLNTAVRRGTLRATRAGGRFFVTAETLEAYRRAYHKRGNDTPTEEGHEDVSLAEAARRTQQSYKRLHAAVRFGALGATRVGRHVRVQMADVQAYLAAHRRAEE